MKLFTPAIFFSIVLSISQVSIAAAETIPEGTVKKFYKSSELKAELPYQKGVLHGPLTTYYKNGAVSWKFNYLDGKREGRADKRYATGELQAVRDYKNGLKNGSAVDYFKSGRVRWMAKYKDGKLIKTIIPLPNTVASKA